MIEETLVKRPREHVTLDDTSIQKLDKWLEQINAKKKINISRKQLVNWLVEKLPENISGSDINEKIKKFYGSKQ